MLRAWLAEAAFRALVSGEGVGGGGGGGLNPGDSSAIVGILLVITTSVKDEGGGEGIVPNIDPVLCWPINSSAYSSS